MGANYHYDEAGNMAAYFLISVLAIVLVPLTLASVVRISASKSFYSSDEATLTTPHRTPRRWRPGLFMHALSRPQKSGPRSKQVVATQPQVHKEVRLPCTESDPWLTSSFRTVILLVGWSVVAFLVSRVRNVEPDNKVYDPYEILGISAVRVHARSLRTPLIPSSRVPRKRKSRHSLKNSPKSSAYATTVCWTRSDHVS